MHEFKTLSVRLIEARRYLTRAARLRDHDPARERWELWLTTADGQEEKHVVALRLMPARSGHAVTLILLDDEPVGMFNLDAGYRVNFVRANPALLLRPVDVALVVFGALASIVASAFTGPVIFVLAVPLLALYIPALAAVRHPNSSTAWSLRTSPRRVGSAQCGSLGPTGTRGRARVHCGSRRRLCYGVLLL